MERGNTRRGHGRRAAEKSNHRHRWLLRARHHRPRNGRTSKSRDELPPPHIRPQAQEDGIVRLK
jgi:hypothetical protein